MEDDEAEVRGIFVAGETMRQKCGEFLLWRERRGRSAGAGCARHGHGPIGRASSSPRCWTSARYYMSSSTSRRKGGTMFNSNSNCRERLNET